MWDGEAFGREVVEAVKDAVERATAPLVARIAALEAREPKPGEPGRPGKDGADATDEQVARVLERQLSPEEGRLDPIAVQVARWFEINPPPKGDPGDPGEPGQPGKDGTSVTAEDLAPMVQRTVAEAVANLPTPKDGRDGVDGKDGANGLDGKNGRDGTDGKDGLGQAGAILSREGALIVTMTDGTQRDLGVVVGRDGRDGVDGKDGERGPAGFSLDKFDVVKTGDRTIELRFSDQTEAFAVELEFPFMIYRGVWTDGQAYTRGDTVTWGGSLYHCDAETTARPGTETWTLAAKKGRDGKAGDKGDKGEPGKKGDPGVDRRY